MFWDEETSWEDMVRVLIVSIHVEKQIISSHHFMSSICCFDVALQLLWYFRKNKRRDQYRYEVSGKPSQRIENRSDRSDRFGNNNSSIKMRQELDHESGDEIVGRLALYFCSIY